MKTLYLLRHAKSSWDDNSLEDHERHLNARGIENAERMGQHMRKKGYGPALVLCSSAARTRETLEHLEPHLSSGHATRYERALYLATPQQLFQLLRTVDDAVPSVLIIAHSPGTEGCALMLARDDGDRAEASFRAEIEEKFPTTALAVLSLPARRWSEVEPGTGILTDFVRPRDL
jgi:phosphohistidine phosphatase